MQSYIKKFNWKKTYVLQKNQGIVILLISLLRVEEVVLLQKKCIKQFMEPNYMMK